MKRLALLVICFLLTGCQAITFSVDSLLSAPNVADEQSAIYQALIESAGRGITLEYPRNGDYRSAFVSYDIDSDGQEETLAFYSVTSVSDSNIKISVLDRDASGDWRAKYELAGAGNSVDKVLFSGSDMLVGYSAQDYEENAVRMYHYADGILQQSYEDTYTILEQADFDGCGTEETAIVKRSGVGAEVDIIKAENDGSYRSYLTELEIGAGSISSYSIGRIGDGSALYLDITPEYGGLLTEVVYLSGESVVRPIYFAGIPTERPAGYFSRDYDGDGEVEIPLTEPFTGYSYAAWGEGEYMTRLYRYNAESVSLELVSNAYYSVQGGYLFTIPNRWLNVVTVSRDQGTGEVTFYRYDPVNYSSVTEMPPIISFASADSAAGEAYISAGYTAVAETDFTGYYVKVRAGDDEPLVLTMDELRDNFHIIE